MYAKVTPSQLIFSSVLESRQLFVSIHLWQSGLSPAWGLVLLTFHGSPKYATWVITSPATWRIRRISTISCMPFMGRQMTFLEPFLDSALTRLRSCSAPTPHHLQLWPVVGCQCIWRLGCCLAEGGSKTMAASIYHSLQYFALSHGRTVCCWHYVYEDC